jgi:predicted transposase YbfD/YdcC
MLVSEGWEDIENSIITLNAIGCQGEIALQIVKEKADYILARKGNHSGPLAFNVMRKIAMALFKQDKTR